jgi:ligand-binding sensor domain-containing protein/signal transduction histidine kinase
MQKNERVINVLLSLFVCLVFITGCGKSVASSTASPAVTNGQVSASTDTTGSGSLPEAIRFTHIGLEDGLSQSSVYCMVQDAQGFIWFGTEDGLNRYDGYNFQVFRPDANDPNSLSDRWISALAADGEGNLWIGTRQGGVNYYDAKTGKFTRYLHDNQTPGSISSNRVLAIYIDQAQRVWVGTNRGLDLYLPKNNAFAHYPPVINEMNDTAQNSVTAIHQDSRGNFWIGTAAAGLFRFDPDQARFSGYFSGNTQHISLSSEYIRGIQEDKEGNLWVATDDGLNFVKSDEETIIQYHHNALIPASLANDYIQTILVDGKGNLWVGTDAGLDRFDPGSGSFKHYVNDPEDARSLSASIVKSLFESTDGMLWVGTYGGSVNMYDSAMDNFRYYRNDPRDPYSLSGDMIFKIFIEDKKYAWIATMDGGLNRLDLVNGKSTAYKHKEDDPGSLISNEVWCVFKDSRGILWVGTTEGLDRLDPGKSAFTHYSMQSSNSVQNVSGVVYEIVEDNDHNLWIGTSMGLARFDHETGLFSHYAHDSSNPDSISSSSVVKVYLDKDGTLWLGTFTEGLDRFDSATGKFIHYRNDPNDPTSLSNNSVLAILQDHSGRLWVSTAGGGLNRLDPRLGGFTHVTSKEGLPNDVVYGILEDKAGNLWLSTNLGISCYDPADGTFLNFTESDGLLGNEFDMNAYAMDTDGNMYFGGVNGLTVFDPATIRKSSFIPPVVLLSITQNGTPLNTNVTPELVKEVSIKWPYNSFEFEFASLSYSDPQKNQYAYMLENFDSGWINAKNWREGRYTNLPGGTYILHLKGTNRDGVWNETGHSITIKVIPAFWQTIWFKILGIAALLGIALAIYRSRTRAIQVNNIELERQVTERTKEIERLFEKTKELAVIEERNRLARELHDSAKQKAFAALAQLGTAGGVLPGNPLAARAHLQEAENLVYEVIEELTFLIQEMYPLALKEKGLATSLREYVFDWETRTDIQAKIQVTDERRVHLDVEQAFYRAIQEALSNVARHSQATEVELTVTYLKKELVAVVKDNGCGFNQETRQAGMGLRTIRERIEALDGSVVIESVSGCGTSITLRAPLRSQRIKKEEDDK